MSDLDVDKIREEIKRSMPFLITLHTPYRILSYFYAFTVL